MKIFALILRYYYLAPLGVTFNFGLNEINVSEDCLLDLIVYIFQKTWTDVDSLVQSIIILNHIFLKNIYEKYKSEEILCMIKCLIFKTKKYKNIEFMG